MSEFSVSPNTSKKTKISSLLLADLFDLCAFIFSHPLYFSYFIFFSPYLLKILSFLSPLFITTSLLVLAYLTFSPTLVQEDVVNSELSKIKLGCLVSAYQTVLERLQKSKVEGSDGDDDHEDFRSFVELEAYKIVFDTSTFEIEENPVEENCSLVFEAPVDDVSSHEDNGSTYGSCEAASDENLVEVAWPGVDTSGSFEAASDENLVEVASPGVNTSGSFDAASDENLVEVAWPGVNTSGSFDAASDENLVEVALPGVETLESFLQERKEENEEVKPPSTHSNKVDEDGKEQKWSMRSRASKDFDNNFVGDQLKSKSMSNSKRLGANLGEYYNMKVMDQDSQMLMSPNLGSFGSMRKEKEWRRTLACKLFEERHHNVDGGGEGMDMLWETYDETESIKVKKGKSKSKKGKNGKVEDDDDEEEEEEEFNGQLCCLQALKFSAGKMNLGMGRPNLVKFSKALKGFGWLHHVTKHGKKGYH